jgi:hypothetical protein
VQRLLGERAQQHQVGVPRADQQKLLHALPFIPWSASTLRACAAPCAAPCPWWSSAGHR